jgi:hypothetical protein
LNNKKIIMVESQVIGSLNYRSLVVMLR